MSKLNDYYHVQRTCWLEIIEDLGVIKKERFCKARCRCGSVKTYKVGNLVNGTTKSCGCYRQSEEYKKIHGAWNKTHGLSKTSLYHVWQNMKKRCYNPACTYYEHYGGRGVTVCDEWKNSFEAFRDWALANGYQEGLELDKDIIPVKLGIPAMIYSPEMCCFTTGKNNCRSRRSTRWITYKGDKKSLAEWVEILKLHPSTFKNKLRDGWSSDEIIEHFLRTSEPMPLRRSNRNTYTPQKNFPLIEYNGISKFRFEWIEYLGIKAYQWDAQARKKLTPQQIIEHFSKLP